MKRMGKYLLIVTLLCSVFAVGYSQEIAYVNSADIIQAMPEMKMANTEIEALSQQLQKKRDDMVTALQKKYADLQEKEKNGELSPKQIQDEAAKLQAENEELAKAEQDMNTQLNNKNQELMGPIITKVQDAIKAVGKELGVRVLLDSATSTILYADESADLTDKVKAKLGIE